MSGNSASSTRTAGSNGPTAEHVLPADLRAVLHGQHSPPVEE